jgi:hypothetical protein
MKKLIIITHGQINIVLNESSLNNGLLIKLFWLDFKFGINFNNINELFGLNYATCMNIIFNKEGIKYLINH